MGITPTIDITVEQRESLLMLLDRHLPDTEAWVYGSRAKWTSHPQSDLDLVVFTIPEQARAVADLREAFEESNLPFRVDLFVWDDVPDSFRKQIEREHVVLTQPRIHTGKWPRVRFGECIAMNEATYSKRENWPFVNYLDTGSITENRIDSFQRLDSAKMPTSARRKVEPGDIVYSRVRPNQRHFGLLREIPENFLASTAFAVFRARRGIADTGFLYWFLTQDRIVDYLQTIGEHSSSVYPSIKPTDILDLDIALPPLAEQRGIARILGALDDKIEHNRRMNRTLEAMAQAIFKDWFVDFGPVRAKMEGRAPYLPPETWKLFPDRFIDSELGEIPEGWPLVALPELMEVNPSRTLRRGEVAPYLDMAAMPTRGHAPAPTVPRPFGSGMRFANGDTLVARITPCLENGKTAFVDFLQEHEIGWGSTEYIVMKPRPPLPNEFAYFIARSARFREFAIQNMSGTSGRQRVPASVLSDFPMPSPSGRLGVEFGRVTQVLLRRARMAVNECRVLANCRDTLLPKLISGAIRIRDAEKVMEAVA